MVLIKRIHNRGATVTVEAHGEVLFAAAGPVGRWTNRFSNRVTAFTAAAAPSNKRPRWGHYGKPLKSTFTSSTTYQPTRMRVYSAVGSTAPHAIFVDQGTGVFGGSGPYPAKILPPWQRGSASLYEATWRPNGPTGRLVAPVMIKGQPGQHFFDKGLAAGFRSMRLRAAHVPGGEARISDAAVGAPDLMRNFVGNTVADSAFRSSLAEWRSWRDDAWRSREGLGRGGGIGSRAHAAATAHSATKPRPHKGSGAKSTSKPKPAAVKAERTRFLDAMKRKYGAGNVEAGTLQLRGGYWYVTIRTKDDRGRTIFKEVRGKSTATG